MSDADGIDWPPDPNPRYRDTPPTEDELRKVAHKAAQIGFTYGALGRDFTFAYKNVEDLLNDPERAKP